MKKKFMATLVALSLSTPLWADDTAVITQPEIAAADVQMLFEQDAQALQVVALSAQEMQETQGAWNPFKAIANLFKSDAPVVKKVAEGVALAVPVVVVGAVALMTGVGEAAAVGAGVAAAGEAVEGGALLVEVGGATAGTAAPIPAAAPAVARIGPAPAPIPLGDIPALELPPAANPWTRVALGGGCYGWQLKSPGIKFGNKAWK
jgi:hypothetical protein